MLAVQLQEDVSSWTGSKAHFCHSPCISLNSLTATLYHVANTYFTFLAAMSGETYRKGASPKSIRLFGNVVV